MNWTHNEIERLKEGINEELTAGQIADRLGCSRSAVIAKARRLGIPLAHPRGRAVTRGIRRTDWSPADIAILREMAERNCKISEIAQVLHRTHAAVDSKGQREGIIFRHKGFIEPGRKRPIVFKTARAHIGQVSKSAVLSVGWDTGQNVISFSKGAHRPRSPRPELQPSPEEKLWRAVLMQAIRDATSNLSRFTNEESRAEAIKTRAEALNWFTKPIWRKNFEWVCSMAGFEPDWVLERLSLEAA